MKPGMLGEESYGESDLTESVQSDADLEAIDNNDISAMGSAEGQIADKQSVCSEGDDVVSATDSADGQRAVKIKN
jgi:hypothetical protein